MEYLENYSSAKLKLNWQEVQGCASISENRFCLELYNNKDFSGFIRQLQPVDSINVDWGENQPDPLVNKDNFAVLLILFLIVFL